MPNLVAGSCLPVWFEVWDCRGWFRVELGAQTTCPFPRVQAEGTKGQQQVFLRFDCLLIPCFARFTSSYLSPSLQGFALSRNHNGQEPQRPDPYDTVRASNIPGVGTEHGQASPASSESPDKF